MQTIRTNSNKTLRITLNSIYILAGVSSAFVFSNMLIGLIGFLSEYLDYEPLLMPLAGAVIGIIANYLAANLMSKALCFLLEVSNQKIGVNIFFIGIIALTFLWGWSNSPHTLLLQTMWLGGLSCWIFWLVKGRS